MAKYINLSDGEKDGIVLFYMKDKKLKAVVMTEEQAGILDMTLGIAFKDGLRTTKAYKSVMLELIEEDNANDTIRED